MPKNIRMESLVQLSVVDADDPNERSLAVTVPTDWWAGANNISKQLMWRGLTSMATEKWAADDAAAEKEAESNVAVKDDATIALPVYTKETPA